MDKRHIDNPFFSICIPQYNRTSFLIEVCKSLAAQTFRNFEVCISDDRSTDGREGELLEFLSESTLSFVYHRQEHNLRYDGNIRASIALSRGKYCFLLGNDDSLASIDTLQFIYDEMRRFEDLGAVITNFAEYSTGKSVRRVRDTSLIGSGPMVAANNFRNVSFVSGIILHGDRARSLATAKWDGSEMYQTYLMSRIVAEGGCLLGLDHIAVRKDIQAPGEKVDSYATKPRLSPCPIVERKHTFHLLGRLVIDAITSSQGQYDKQSIAERVLFQLLVFTFPFWIFEYRRVQSWNYAAGICIGMRPANFAEGVELSFMRKLRLTTIFLLVSLAGLTLPIGMFDKLSPWLYAIAKSAFGRSMGEPQHV